jgi:iron complex transport system substrate-binding protein
MTVLTQRRRDTERPRPRDFVMEINDVSGSIVDRAMKIHQALGPGLLESVYHRVLAYELRKAGFEVETEVPIPVEWDGNIIDESFRADVIVNGQVLIELKSVESISSAHKKQTLTYLKLSKIKLGLLINFGSPLLKDGLHRIANDLPE